jgi:hypothetical protein
MVNAASEAASGSPGASRYAVAAAAASGSPADKSFASPESKRAVIEHELRLFNLVLCLLHLAQGFAVFAASLVSATPKSFVIPMYTSVPSWRFGYPSADLQFRYSVPFAGLTSGLGFITAVGHFAVLAFFPFYLAGLRRGINVFRWLEYAVSSSLMIVLIAMLFGALR